eukprot:TRINITY_DN2079_c0_g1_i1.p1 TRINITY_DN2079_c0_g1~~TRINITY_DN2079_c0_g1_i1.p1  ORF type:complete len:184 (-),score=37.07 TRINITY_DN2079_c0_g1_i1:28-579(-)
MVGSSNITTMRKLFADPTKFIVDAIVEVKKFRYTGINIDFEPDGDETNPEDGVQFAQFLDTFAKALHLVRATLSVDIASWDTKFWNFTAIAETSVDTLCLMDTYTSNYTDFKFYLDKALTDIPIERLGVGLITTTPDNRFIPASIMDSFFHLLMELQICEIDIWDTPIPDDWWTLLNEFINRP